MERGYTASFPKPAPLGANLGALRLPRIAHSRGSFHLPYLEIKLTFECTARFYGLAPPLFSSPAFSTAYFDCDLKSLFTNFTPFIS